MTARTIVITGASDGIGASAARTLSLQGERVVVVGRSAEKTAKIATESAPTTSSATSPSLPRCEPSPSS